MNKWKHISIEGLPIFHVWDSGITATETVIFATEDKTIHLGYCVETTLTVAPAVGPEKVTVIHRWFDQRGEYIENVDRWAPLPED